MSFEDLTPEQKEKAKACESPEELLELARKLGYVLSDEELESVAAGSLFWSCSDETKCPPDICTNVCTSGSSRSGSTELAENTMRAANPGKTTGGVIAMM